MKMTWSAAQTKSTTYIKLVLYIWKVKKDGGILTGLGRNDKLGLDTLLQHPPRRHICIVPYLRLLWMHDTAFRPDYGVLGTAESRRRGSNVITAISIPKNIVEGFGLHASCDAENTHILVHLWLNYTAWQVDKVYPWPIGQSHGHKLHSRDAF